MASTTLDPMSDEAILAFIAERRAEVIEAITRVRPETRGSTFCATAVAESETRVYKRLADTVCVDPAKRPRANIVAWLVDKDLWTRLGPNSEFPYERPAQSYGPICHELLAYAQRRLGVYAAMQSPTAAHANNPVTQPPAPAPVGNTAVAGVVDADTLCHRFEQLCARTLPDDTAAWPRIIWEAIRQGPPPPGGDYFSVPLAGACESLASPDIITRANLSVMDQARIIDNPPIALRGPRQLAVIFSPSGDPNIAQQLAYFLFVWGAVELWHRQVVRGLITDPLDKFISMVLREGIMQACVWMDERGARLGN